MGLYLGTFPSEDDDVTETLFSSTLSDCICDYGNANKWVPLISVELFTLRLSLSEVKHQRKIDTAIPIANTVAQCERGTEPTLLLSNCVLGISQLVSMNFKFRKN